MTKLAPHNTVADPEYGGHHLASVLPATKEQVDFVLSQSEDDEDGRSNWVWVRLANGDLILGVYPQGDTYETITQTMLCGEV